MKKQLPAASYTLVKECQERKGQKQGCIELMWANTTLRWLEDPHPFGNVSAYYFAAAAACACCAAQQLLALSQDGLPIDMKRW